VSGDEERITLDGVEVDGWEWVPADRIGEYVIPRLARRLSNAYRAHRAGTTLHLEHGVPAFPDP
jgi:8-oxo-dGTP diphosphatase